MTTQPPTPPAAAGTGAGSKTDPYWINTRPLPDPVNAFRFAAHQLRENVENVRKAGAPREVLAKMESSAEWLDYVGSHVDFESRDPVLCLAVSRTALDGRLRLSMSAALQEVHALVTAVQNQRTGG